MDVEQPHKSGTSFSVETEVYSGPLDLLIDLIEKRKLLINDISLASVTDDYLEYVAQFEKNPLREMTEFIVLASTLLLLKSKSLLPVLELTEEEEGDIKSLEERLRLYELFTKLGGNVKEMFGEKMIFAPLERKSEVLVFLPDTQITKESMMGFAKDCLGAMPKKIFMPEVEVRKVISIEEMIGNLTERIQTSIKMSFKDFAGKAKTKEEKVFAIVGFLAILELVRNGILHVVQEKNFEDIMIEKREEIKI